MGVFELAQATHAEMSGDRSLTAGEILYIVVCALQVAKRLVASQAVGTHVASAFLN